ncbi:hypothetical protein ACF1GX_14655 [Streptomyces albidoflavus]
MPTSITITSEFSGSVVAKGATDDLSAQLLRHAGFKQIDDWHGRRHRLPTTTPLADQVAIASLTATEQAMLHTARARAFGKMGNVRDTMAAVGAADEAFTRARPAEDPSWMAYYDEAQHNGDTAHALFDLAILAGQDPGRAARRFNTAVKGHTDAYKRSRAISRTRLASLLMAKGDPRQAAALGHDALNEVGRLTSLRAADDLRQLGRFASKHRTVQEASALRDRIAATVSA